MAKFKRFDPSNRKATPHGSKYNEFSERRNKDDDYTARKAKYDEERLYYAIDEESGEDKVFQPQKFGIRL
jgi:hypothetical protein